MSRKDEIGDYYLWDNLTKTCDGQTPPFKKPSISEFIALLDEAENAEAKMTLPPLAPLAIDLSRPNYTDKLLGPAKSAPQNFDVKTYKKLSKSRIIIERRLDLHGAQQDRAYSLLLSFLRNASGDNLRYVIVITGKGARNGAILQTMVPKWLQWGAAAQYVSAFATASAKHGASGALYVRLRAAKSNS